VGVTQIGVCWHVTALSVTDRYRCFGRTCWIDFQTRGVKVEVVDFSETLLAKYTASCSRRWNSDYGNVIYFIVGLFNNDFNISNSRLVASNDSMINEY
jgi:hypothetical protein